MNNMTYLHANTSSIGKNIWKKKEDKFIKQLKIFIKRLKHNLILIKYLNFSSRVSILEQWKCANK